MPETTYNLTAEEQESIVAAYVDGEQAYMWDCGYDMAPWIEGRNVLSNFITVRPITLA